MIVGGQTVLFKKVKLKNSRSSDLEEIQTTATKRMKNGQLKMISKEPVKLRKPDGQEIMKRIMITGRIKYAQENGENSKVIVDHSLKVSLFNLSILTLTLCTQNLLVVQHFRRR